MLNAVHDLAKLCTCCTYDVRRRARTGGGGEGERAHPGRDRDAGVHLVPELLPQLPGAAPPRPAGAPARPPRRGAAHHHRVFSPSLQSYLVSACWACGQGMLDLAAAQAAGPQTEPRAGTPPARCALRAAEALWGARPAAGARGSGAGRARARRSWPA